MKYKIAIMASGNGSNAENIIRYFEKHKDIEVVMLIATKDGIGAIERAKRLGMEYEVCLPKTEFAENGKLQALLADRGITHIVLAGCLAMIPGWMLKAYGDKILNIHPSLLPKYGGKGMYGGHVHEAVIAAGEKESGITIHMVNEIVDAGKIVFQAKCPVMPDDTPDTLAARVHKLEYEHFPKVIEEQVLDSE
ncbi:MAG: phosphoribosylglycinamide formyltransferase [Bacteroidaceae bacterium]|nr:phosphoribosylglycinamide formyltransferase [Bacteroidaceae bacterium]